MRILSLDLSTKTGWAFCEDEKLIAYGVIPLDISGFDINGKASKSPNYPFNFIQRSEHLADTIENFVVKKYNPTHIVIENTVLGRNRHAQRLLEFIHYAVLKKSFIANTKVLYLDPSEWRAVLGLRFSKEQKEHNTLLREKKGRGLINKKHLSVNFVNTTYGLSLMLKQNDIADAIALNRAAWEKLK